MSKTITGSNFRNPFFILLCYLLMVLPYFSILCSIDLSNKLFWGGIQTCANAFMVDSFIETSVWVVFFVILILEILRFGIRKLELRDVPSSFEEWVRLQAKVIILLLIPFAFWIALSWAFEFLANSMGKEFSQESIAQSFIKVQSFGLLAFNLNSYLKIQFLKNNPLSKKLKVNNEINDTIISLAEILWIEKTGKKYFVFTPTRKFEVYFTLQELEEELPHQVFKRINRSVIININEISSFAFWENEKYILKLKNKKEFVITRKRILELKKLLQNQNKQRLLQNKFPFLKV